MKLLDENQITNQIGRSHLQTLYEGTKYMGGIQPIDFLIKKGKLDTKISIPSFTKRDFGIEIIIYIGFTKHRVALPLKNVNYWTIEQQQEIVTKKSKSVIGRALVGGILLGPLGAIVGGITGVGDKKVKISDIDNILSISYTEDGKDKMMLFSVPNKKHKKVFEFFTKFYGNKYITPLELEKQSQIKSSSGISITDELMKLKDLEEKGIITKHEFELGKRNLLKHT